jgi:Zn-dependent alcohol dehydrogenase
MKAALLEAQGQSLCICNDIDIEDPKAGQVLVRVKFCSLCHSDLSLLGSCNSLLEIPRLIGLWQAGKLDLESLITAKRPLEEVNEAFDDLRAGRGIRTVLSI